MSYVPKETRLFWDGVDAMAEACKEGNVTDRIDTILFTAAGVPDGFVCVSCQTTNKGVVNICVPKDKVENANP